MRGGGVKDKSIPTTTGVATSSGSKRNANLRMCDDTYVGGVILNLSPTEDMPGPRTGSRCGRIDGGTEAEY